MQRNKGRDFFDLGDPFGGFGGFGDHRSLMASFFNKDPFGDPFFTRPYRSMFGSSMFAPSMFGPSESIFGNFPNSGFVENQAPQPNKSKGPVIEEIPSDDNMEDEHSREKKDEPRKTSKLSKRPTVEDPDDEKEENQTKHIQYRNEYNRMGTMRPQNQSFSFHSSTVTYGGANGGYYTSSTTRRMGGDGLVLEEKKEADSTTGRATHKISRGIHDKGHSITRKLNPDGKVDTVQTLHNLNKDELAGFEKKWKGNVEKQLPGWNEGFKRFIDHAGASSSGDNMQRARGWALPSTKESPANEGQAKSNTFKPSKAFFRRK